MCGGGTQSRTRTVTTPAANGGTACPALTDSQACNTTACAVPVDCAVSAWSQWTSCSAMCGGGTQSRTRTVTTPAANGGAACPALTDSQTCNTGACPIPAIDCVVSDWSDWSTCSVLCGGGTQTRSRHITTPPNATGASCPALTDSRGCNPDACPLPVPPVPVPPLPVP